MAREVKGGSESGGGRAAAPGSEEGSGATLALDETFDAVRGGARLILNYDAASNCFHRHRGKHHRQRTEQRENRGAPLQRDRAWPDDYRWTWLRARC